MPFTKGDPNINRKGRPPRRSFSAVLDEAVTDEDRQKIAEAMLKKAKAGDQKAAEFIADRLDGKPRQAMELSGPEGTAIKLKWESDADA